ncbi:short-chain dehydrogenase/reductase [Pseudorhodoferax sp. Leaf267]|uniref:short-chain dehydrogenase/reductase n=1 Tax=Pseudorhodoferax sp. Leaf267 TaxID=1736316 RepID=UPI0006F88B6F|nr:short-chain dehydrogenase/reductase [Pseudorhodoferax sp. Leaf267]KQP19398.1 short-chain dehydrogenase [Pseudorhodoferax sp. Leaf267]
MELELKGKTALVTGSSKGIGRAVAMELAREGCRVHLAARSLADLEAIAQEIADTGAPRPEVHAIDLAERGSPAALAHACGDLDILVNNAGAIPRGTVEAIGEDRWREAWDLKVFGTIDLSRAVFSRMKARRSGVVVNVIGMAGERNSAEYIVGSTGNAALMAFTRGLGGASMDDGIRVVGVNPGPVNTERMESLLRQQAMERFGDAERWRECQDTGKLPAGRAATAREIADVVVFLASPRASYISGTVISVDGGKAFRA